MPWSSFVSSTEIMPDTEVCRQAGEGRGGGTIQVDGEGMQGADREMSRGRGSTEFMPDTEVCRQGGGRAGVGHAVFACDRGKKGQGMDGIAAQSTVSSSSRAWSGAEEQQSTALAALLIGSNTALAHLFVDQAGAASHVCPHIPAGTHTSVWAGWPLCGHPWRQCRKSHTHAQQAALLAPLPPPLALAWRPARAAHPGCSRVHTTLCPARSALRLLFTMFSAALLAR